MSGVDVRVEHHGSLFTLHAVSDAGYDWIEENVAQNEGLAMTDIVAGAHEAGLRVQA